MAQFGWLSSVVLAFSSLLMSNATVARADLGTSTSNWSSYGNWGYCYTATFGQTFVGNGEACSGFRFRFYNESCCAYVPFRAVLCRWDAQNNRAIGPILAQADSQYSNYGCCWFDKTITFANRVPLVQGENYVVFFSVTPWWNQYGCRNAEFAIRPDSDYTQGSMYILGNGSDPNQWTTSSWSHVGYDINFTVYTTNDCDGNGIPDSTEIAAGTAPDCNANGLSDLCEGLAPGAQSYDGEPRGPIGATASVTYEFDRVLPAQGDVSLRISANADISATHEFLLVTVGFGAARAVFTGAESDCAWHEQTITIPRDEFNAAIVKDTLVVTVSGSPTVDAAACGGESQVALHLEYTEAYRDCNDNLVSDFADICEGTSVDCNANRNPDECDIASGASADVDGDGTPDECQPDCNNDARPDAFQIFIGEEPDCNANRKPDECDLYTGGGSVDCNANGVPDECDIAAGTALDCDLDGKIDSCALSQGVVPDCNANGVPDSCDIASGFAQDCDEDGNPDSCNIAGVWRSTPTQTPFYSSYPLQHTMTGLQPVEQDVTVELQYYAYTYGYYGQYVRLYLDGGEYYSFIDNYWGGCSQSSKAFNVSRDTWNSLVSDGQVQVYVVQESGAQCSSYGGYARVRVLVQPPALDCNSNGIPDDCDVDSGFDHDCNNNGALDGCDIANGAEDDNKNGYPDPCELDRGDLNMDGVVAGQDLAILLSYWGGTGYTIGDMNHDGVIDGADLAIMLSNWGETL
ncbi:MAG: hypothetical protein QM516_02440 [Limnohabitans sp.]|nr:hypothetical protein [Limnohabitans sp.]